MGIIRIPRRKLMELLEGDRASLKGVPPVPLGATGADLLNAGAQYHDGSEVWHLFSDLSYGDAAGSAVQAAEPEARRMDRIPDGWGQLHRVDGGAWVMLNVKDYGIRGDGTPNDPAKVVAMIEDALSRRDEHGGGVELYWPAGNYIIDGPVEISRDTFEFYHFRMRGAGKDQTKIGTRTDWQTLFRFVNTGNKYSAQLSFHGFHFTRGDTAIYIENPFYGEIVDCAFRNCGRNGGYGIHMQGTATMFRIQNCWFFHTDNILHAVGYTTMIGCDIGEDAGGIMVDGTLQAVGCKWHASTYMQNSQSVTPSALVVTPGSSLSVVGCQATRNNSRPFVEVDLPQSVHLANNHFWNYGGCPVVTTDRPGSGVTWEGGTFYTIGDAPLWAKHGTAQTIRNCTIRNLRIIDPNNRIITVPDDFFDPDNRNIYEGNQVST